MCSFSRLQGWGRLVAIPRPCLSRTDDALLEYRAYASRSPLLRLGYGSYFLNQTCFPNRTLQAGVTLVVSPLLCKCLSAYFHSPQDHNSLPQP
jgi:hypothetical protein